MPMAKTSLETQASEAWRPRWLLLELLDPLGLTPCLAALVESTMDMYALHLPPSLPPLPLLPI